MRHCAVCSADASAHRALRQTQRDLEHIQDRTRAVEAQATKYVESHLSTSNPLDWGHIIGGLALIVSFLTVSTSYVLEPAQQQLDSVVQQVQELEQSRFKTGDAVQLNFAEEPPTPEEIASWRKLDETATGSQQDVRGQRKGNEREVSGRAP